jgi:arylsulfatase A-like enzyme
MTDRPNILVIMTDQQRSDSLGCYGADWLQTPNLDALAAGGTRFATCTINNSICTPSRASIFTGKELPGHGVYRLHDRLPDTETLFPDRLRTDADYRTALFGKLHVSGRVVEEAERHPKDGFEVYEWCIESCVSMESRFNGYVSWLRDRDPAFLDDLRARKRQVKHHPEEVHFTRWAAERTVDYIRERARCSEPFLCVMSIFDPHNPYEDYPLSMADRVDRARIPEPIAKQFLPECAIREREGSYLGADFSAEALRDMRFGYAASIAFADQEIGKVLAALDECGIADDTLVIFMSDHGDSLGDHGLMVKGVALYEPAINVPLILRWPGHVPAGHCSTALAQGHDIARTCFAAAGLAPPRDGAFDTGEDLVAVAAGADTRRRVAVTAYRNSGINRDNAYWDPPMIATSVRGPHDKLIAYSSGDAVEYEFFDLALDPKEQTNRFGDPASLDRTLALFAELTGWLQRESAFAGSRGGGWFPASDSFMENTLNKA